MIYKVENINNAKFTQAIIEKAYSAMSPERRQKADKLRFDNDKKLCILSDMLLREMLSETFGITCPEFALSEKGKPYLKNGKAHFNISHSKDFFACAVDSKPVGIDIEAKKLIHTQLLRRVCTEDELIFITGQSELPTTKDFLSEEEALKFLQVWTAKEAYIKYTGKGLSTELTSFSTAENAKLKTHLAPNLALFNLVTPEYILSIVSEETQ